jgi:polyribonucleotide nucleotidyltransferase
MRLASSLDELTQARLLARNISQKTGLNPSSIMTSLCSQTYSILQKNENVVRKIANLLVRDGVVRRKALGPILAQVLRLS